MGSINLHQSAGLCAQPEAVQDNPQICRLPEQQCYAICLPDPFFPTHTQKRKSGLAMRD